MSISDPPPLLSLDKHTHQHTFSMSLRPFDIRHNGLLHDLESAAAATASALNVSISAAEGDNQSQSGGHARSRRPIWYISRGFPVLCLAIVLLLSIRHGILTLRHKYRVRQRLNATGRGGGSHEPLATEDPDDEPFDRANSPSGTMSDSTLIEPLSPKNHTDAEDRLLAHDDTDKDHTPVSRRRGSGPYFFAALEAAQRNWLYLRTIPRWLYGPETMADALWTVGYCALMFAFALACIPLNTEFWYLYFANGLGVLAFCQCPLIIVLIQKNNPISFLTGITYQKLNYLHRASSRVALLFSWIHFLLWTPSVWRVGHFSHWYIIWGLCAISGFTGLWLTSFRVVRRVAFEFFLVAHILFTIVFMGGALLHWYRLGFWMWPCFVIWGLDRLIRGIRLVYLNPPPFFQRFGAKNAESNSAPAAGQCEIRLLSRDVMLITAKRPGLRWGAGQHFFLSSPSVSVLPTEAHPFSVANMPNDRDEVIFLIRVHGGFTRRLRDALSGDIDTNIPIYLEGPYGSSHPISSYSTVILIAGGTGITFLSSNLLSLLQPGALQISRNIHLIWHIRHASDTAWLSCLLNEAADLLHQSPFTRLNIDIHVTKSHRADEPAPAVGITDRLVGEFGPRRFSILVQGDKHDLGSADVSELPSAVVSDDEDEEGSRQDADRETHGRGERSSRSSSDQPRAPTRDGPRVASLPPTTLLGEQAHESQDDGEAGDSDTMLSHPFVSRKSPSHDDLGLTSAARALISWNHGRADLRAVLEDDLKTTNGPVNVTVCGPVQLMHAARRAVREVATPLRALRGDWPIDFYEETLGS